MKILTVITTGKFIVTTRHVDNLKVKTSIYLICSIDYQTVEVPISGFGSDLCKNKT